MKKPKQISIKVSDYLYMLVQDAARADNRDMANWIRLNLEKIAHSQLKRSNTT